MNETSPSQVVQVQVQSELHHVIVCDGGSGGFAAWPDLLRMPNGTLICSLYHGYAHGSPPTDAFPTCGKMVCVFSQDNGMTWSKPVTMVDTDGDDHDGHLVLLKDDRLICNYFCEQFYRQENGRKVRIQGRIADKVEVYTIESKDGGKTWREPRVVPTCWQYISATSGSILELPNGHLIMPIYGLERDDKNAGVGIVRSEDGGRTWGPVTLLVTGLPSCEANEMGLVRLNDGRLLALIRQRMIQCYSSDDGLTWTKPQPVGIPGHAPCVIQLRSGVVVCAIRIIDDNGKTWKDTGVIVSRDNGKTWWGPYAVDTVSGAYPGLAEMPDGSVYIVYYEEGAGSRIRGSRFRLTDEGIDLIPPAKWK